MTSIAKTFKDQFSNNVFIENNSAAVVDGYATISVWHSFAAGATVNSVESDVAMASDAQYGSLAPLKPNSYKVSFNQYGGLPIRVDIGGMEYSASFDQQTATLIANRPDWSTPPQMKLSYLTEVIVSFDGSEQRISVRDKPRLSVSYSIPVVDDDRYAFESDFIDTTDLLFVPLWHLQKVLGYEIIAGDSVIKLKDSNAYINSSQRLLISEAGVMELVEVSYLAGGLVSLTQAVKNDFSSSAIITPVVVARHADESSARSILSSFDMSELSFDADEVLFEKPGYSVAFDKFHTGEAIVDSLAEFVGERYVFPFRPDRTSDVSIQHQRLREVLDTQTGARSVYERTQGAIRVFSYSFRFFTEVERQRFEDFADLHKGAQKEFYFEGPGKFFDLLAPISAPTNSIVIKYQGLSKRTASTPPGISIKLYNGTTVYNAITQAVDNKDGTETITLLNLMQDLDVEYIAPLYLGRFDSDDFTYAFDTSDVSTLTKTIRQLLYADTIENRVFAEP